MKLAALQLMQQKASNMENSTPLENGSPPSPESKSEDPVGPEAGSEEEGGNASGLAKVKELAETIASDDGTGGLLWVRGAPALSWPRGLHGQLQRGRRRHSPAMPPQRTRGAGR